MIGDDTSQGPNSALTSQLEPEKHWVSTRSGRIAVSTWGERTKPPLVLLHGMRDHARNWDWTAAALRDRYYVVAPDLRGHGDSDRTARYLLADYVGDLAAVADALHLGRFSLACHSFGGNVGMRYAAAFPERVVALCGIECRVLSLPVMPRDAGKPYPVLLREWVVKERASNRRSPPRYASLEEAAKRVTEQHPLLDTDTVAHLTKHAVQSQPDGSLSWKYDIGVRARTPEDIYGKEFDETLAAIICPVLLINGDASWLPLPDDARLALLRDHQAVRFEGAGHWLHHEQRDRFLSLLDSFLANQKDKPHA
jgi:pimeloyl-ACP methyl ester carboxylesterase